MNIDVYKLNSNIYHDEIIKNIQVNDEKEIKNVIKIRKLIIYFINIT